MDKRFLEECLAREMSLEAIGGLVGKHPSTVSYWLKKHGLNALGTEKYAGRGAVSRDELQALTEAGSTLDEMAERLDRSVSTVRYWLGRYGIERARPRRGRGHDARYATFVCKRHGRTRFVLEGRGYYRCKRCRAAGVAKRRRRVKRKLVEEAGGKCALCGYSRWLGALQFHHLDPSERSSISRIEATPGQSRRVEPRCGSACCCAPTATPRSRVDSLRCRRVKQKRRSQTQLKRALIFLIDRG